MLLLIRKSQIIPPATTVAQADQEYAEWQARQAPVTKSLPLTHLLRKSVHVKGAHHTNRRGTSWNSHDYNRYRSEFLKRPKGKAAVGRGGKSKGAHIAELLISQPSLHAPTITGHTWDDIITKAKRYYVEKVYRKPVIAPAFGTEVFFESRSLVYAAAKGKEEYARRMALLPKAIEVIKNSLAIDPHDTREVLPPDSNSKDHKRYGLYGRFDDGMVISVIVEEMQQEGKKFLSVFDFKNLEGDKFNKYLEAVGTGPTVRHMQQTPDGDPHAPIGTIAKSENDVNKSHSGGRLLNPSISADSFCHPIKTAFAGNESRIGNDNLLAPDAHGRVTERPVFLQFPVNKQLSVSYHNILQKPNLPSGYKKPHRQNDIRQLTHLIKARSLDGRIEFNGLQLSIETGRSRSRHWRNPHDGSEGMSRMHLPYGYIKGSQGVDGDHYDCFVGQDREAPNVYIVTTMKAPDFTTVDEEKVFLGLKTAEEAKRIYLLSYSDPRFFGGMTEMPFAEFKEKVLATKNNPELLAETAPPDKYRMF